MEGKTELQRNAFNTARRKALEEFQRACDMEWLNSRMEDGRMGQYMTLIKREAEMEKDFQERTDHDGIVNARAKKDSALGKEIKKVCREEVCQLSRRHYLRERDPELRTLVQKLQAGYVCRDLKQQILNNEYKRLQDKVQESQAGQEALNKDKEKQEIEEKQKIERNQEYFRELQQQLVNKQRVRQCAYEESLIEKKKLEDIDRFISDEDKRELQYKRETRDRLQQEMVTFQKAREAWKQKQKEMLVIEERKIEEQQQAVTDRTASIIAERERRQRVKEETSEKIVAKIRADEVERKERSDIIRQLQELEWLEKNDNEEIEEIEKVQRMYRETREALFKQMEINKRLEEEQKQRDVELRKRTEAQVAAENEKERQKQLKSKDKKREYAKELLRQMEENARRKKKDRESSEISSIREYETSWIKECQEERKKIITEHAPHVLGHVQCGVITPQDLPYVRQGANQHEHLKSLDIEGMGRDYNRPKIHPKCNPQCKVLREY